MDKNVCRVCQKELDGDVLVLHKHIKTHKILLAEYYQKYHPRYDMYDGTLIQFKSLDYYLNNDFNSRSNLIRWLGAVEKEKALEYCRRIISARVQEKKLAFAPSQVQLRSSSKLPGMNFFESKLGGYEEFCKSINIKPRYLKSKFSEGDGSLGRASIIIDTREQNPLDIKGRTKDECLKYGDYAALDSSRTCKCVIERKSVSDFYGTLSGGLDRFKREIQRAKDDDAYLVVLVESDMEEVKKFPYHASVRYKRIPSAEFVFRNMRELMGEFDCIQFLFVRDRNEAARVLKIVLSHGCEAQDVDLQYAYDSKQL